MIMLVKTVVGCALAALGAVVAAGSWGGSPFAWWAGIIVGFFVLRMMLSDTIDQARRDSEYLERGGRIWRFRDFQQRRSFGGRRCGDREDGGRCEGCDEGCGPW
jgi:hypothetical protein